ncbi:haloacid dehalogenase type II [Actinomadura viridis]|uniref:2-haloacid dehalogenase n=1 Tax=Actinomadura viridis TaxID=58110 RepID=A0A931DQC6_9ACTN|nr:haloacid dehalogenase type II [Actinomadura viridis]MBG6091856.1 2-haloacid dehalogenase [Actinomadura viridis]
MPSRPRVVAFDVNETSMALEPLRTRFEEVGLPGHLLETWFARTLRDGMALGLAGDFEPFRIVAESALRAVGGYRIGEPAIEHVLDGFAALPAHPDLEPALRRLAEAGVRAVFLTNGARSTTEDFVARAGLGELVEGVITIGEVARWKPSAAVYGHAASVTGVPAGRLALVAAHAWDCHGAKRAGLVTGWVSRLEGRYAEIFAAPDVRGDDLVEVVEGLLALGV